MKMLGGDQGVFPNFLDYVKREIPKLISVPLVVKNLQFYGNLTYIEARDALAWGMGPTIVIMDLDNGQCGVPSAYGCFVLAAHEIIEIGAQTVIDYEMTQTTDSNIQGKPVYVVGATLLHELCHWGNKNNVPPIPEFHEMGAAFETATYGKVIV